MPDTDPQYDKVPAPKFAEPKEESTWVDGLEDVFRAIGAGGMAMTDATQNTTFYKDYMARQQKEADKQEALEKEDRDMQRRAWEMEQQHTNEVAKIKIAKEEANDKQRQADAQNLTNSIISASDSSTNLNDMEISYGNVVAREVAVINSDLSDSQKQAQLAQLGAERKVLENRMVKPRTAGQVKSALEGEPHPTKEGVTQSRATLMQDFNETDQATQEAMLADPDFAAIVKNTDAVLPALRNAQALGIDINDADGNPIILSDHFLDPSKGAESLLRQGMEVDFEKISTFSTLSAADIANTVLIGEKAKGLDAEREGAEVMLGNLEDETYGIDAGRLKAALDKYYSEDNLIVRDGKAEFITQGGDIFGPAIAEMKTFVQGATKEQLYKLGRRLHNNTLSLPGMEQELGEVLTQAQERLENQMAVATPIEKEDFFMEMTAEQEDEINKTIVESSNDQNTSLRSYLLSLEEGPWTHQLLQELESYTDERQLVLPGEKGRALKTVDRFDNNLDLPMYRINELSDNSRRVFDKFATTNGLPSSAEMIQQIGRRRQAHHDALGEKLFESYMHAEEVEKIDSSIKMLTAEISKNKAVGVDTAVQEARLEQMTAMRSFRAVGKEGSAHVAVRSTVHQALDKVIGGEEQSVEEKVSTFQDVVAEVFGRQKDEMPLNLKNLTEYFSTDAPFEKQILLALENNATALLPTLVVSSDPAAVKLNTLVFRSAIDDLRSLIRLSNSIDKEERGSDYALVAGEESFKGDDEDRRLNTLATTLKVIKNHTANR